MRPRLEIIRITICSDGISKLKNSTACSDITACSATLIAKAVLPMDGRAAKITRSDFCSPDVFLSRSVKPVARPVMAPLVFVKSSTFSMAFANSGPTFSGPPSFVRCSAIWYTACSARSNRVLLSRPSGVNAESAIWFAAPISWRNTERSRTMRP